MYIPLHAHDESSSVGDSILKLEDYVKRGKEMGLSALGISNHGSISSMYVFSKLCKQNEIKPIFGNEFYMTTDTEEQLMSYINGSKKERDLSDYKPSAYTHLVIIAETQQGLENLILLTSHSSTNTFYNKPLLTEEMLFKHNKGLIVLTACLGGALPKMIMTHEKESSILDYLRRYHSIFKDRFFLELQPMKTPEQMLVNKELVRYSNAYNIPVVATNDIHYLNQSDAFIHNIHVIDCRENEKQKKTKSKYDFRTLLYGDDCFYFMKEEEVVLPGIDVRTTKKAIAQTEEIARRCDVTLNTEVKMPIYSSDQEANLALLKKIAYEKLLRISPLVKNPYVYAERLSYELSVIQKLGYVDYFLIIWDVLKFARSKNIKVGPGRGSVCNSLLAYLLDITSVDSIKYKLIFERFLSEYRTSSIPDIDLDIESTKRGEIIAYLQSRYCATHCAQVRTKMMRKAKSAIKDAGRVLNMSPTLAQEIANLIPTICYTENGNGDTEQEKDLSIERSLEVVPELRAYQLKYPELFELAIGLQDLTRSNSIHAAGIIIYPEPLDKIMPLCKGKEDSILATSLTLKDAENVGVKFDFLSLKSLDFIGALEKATGFVFDLEDDALEDTKVWQTIGSFYTAGLFQISSYIYKSCMHRICPRNIEDLAAALALIRGPCIAAKLDKEYMAICEGESTIKRVHPIYDQAVSNTKGIMVYQEQNMRLFENAGMTREESFKLMKLLAKKNSEDAKVYKNKFYTGCMQHKVDENTIRYIWDVVEKAALYSFNCGHATGYSLLCYITAYYKTHYTKTFFTLLLSHVYKNDKNPKDKLWTLSSILKELQHYQYKIILPDINRCVEDFIDIEGTPFIMAGTCAIKTFGGNLDSFKALGHIHCVNDLFGGWSSVCASTKKEEALLRKDCDVQPPPKKAVVAAIFSGLLDQAIKLPRKDMYDEYLRLRKIYGLSDICTEKVTLSQKETISINDSYEDLEKAFYRVNF